MEALLNAIAKRLVPEPPHTGAAVPFTPDQARSIRRLAAEVAGSADY
jgi:hypothetical protein